MEQPSYTAQLLMELNQQRCKGHLCDVIIVVENTLFRAHKNVLAACSSYFKCMVLQDNLITLNTELVKPSVFKQVLDFIYTGQLQTSHHGSNVGVSDLLRAASYLQLSDLAAVCCRKLKPCRSSASSLSANGHLQRGHSYQSGSTEVGKSHEPIQDGLKQVDLSKEEPFTAQHVSVRSSSAVETNESVARGTGLRLKLTRKSSAEQSSPQSSSNSSVDVPLSNTSAFYSFSLEHGEQRCPTSDSQQTSVQKRPRSGSEGGLEGSVRTKREEVHCGELAQAQWRVSSEQEDQAQVGEEDVVLQTSEESGGEDKEVDRSKHASYIYNQPQPGFQVALDDTLYMCIPCGKGFPSSEQLSAHVDSHGVDKLRVVAEGEAEGSFTKAESPEPKDLPSQSTKQETTKPDAPLTHHVCQVCSKSYMDAALLRQHERNHWQIRPFSCDVCGKVFTQRGTMTRHMRSHLDLKPFACEECGMRFTRHYRKMEHMRTHSRATPYECQVCGVKFAQQRSVISHLKMHTVVS